MKKIASTREQTRDPAESRTQEQGRQVTATLNAVDAAITAIAREMRGVRQIVIADADQTLSLDEAAYGMFNVSGAQTQARRLNFPAETDETARVIWISNVTTGGFAVVIATENGSVNVPSLTTCAVAIRASGPARLT